MVIKVYLVAAGGLTLLMLLIFQGLVGLRKIRFPGVWHLRVHRWTAYAMLAGAVGHGTFAVGTLIFGWF